MSNLKPTQLQAIKEEKEAALALKLSNPV